MALTVNNSDNNQFILLEAAIIAQDETTASILRQDDEDATHLTTTKAKKGKSKILTSQAPVLSGATQPKSPSSKPVNPTPNPVPKPVVQPIIVFAQEDNRSEKRKLKIEEFDNHLLFTTMAKQLLDKMDVKAISTPATTVKLSQLDDPTPAQKQEVFNMITCMVDMLMATLTLAKNQAKVNSNANQVSNEMVTNAEAQAAKVVAEVQAAQAAAEAASHESWWQKVEHAFESLGDLLATIVVAVVAPVILATNGGNTEALKDKFKTLGNDFLSNMAQSGSAFQDIVAGLMMVAGLLTENPMLVVMGVMMVTGLQSKINDGLEDAAEAIAAFFGNKNSGAVLAIKLALEAIVAVVVAGITCGGSAPAAVETTASDEAESAGADVAANAAADGAGAAADVGAAAAGDSAAAAEESTEAVGQSIVKKGAADVQQSAIRRALIRSLMIASMTGFYSDLFKGAIESVNAMGGPQTGADKESEVANIGGAILGAAATFGSAALEAAATAETEASSFAMQKLEGWLGKDKLVTLTTMAKAFSATMAAASAAQNVVQGTVDLKLAASQQALADAQSQLSLYNDLLSIVTAMISSNTNTTNQLFKAASDENSRWDAIFVAPWNQA